MANKKKGFKKKIKRRTTTRIKNGTKISGKGGWTHAGKQIKNTKRMLESIAKEEKNIE